MDVPSLQEVQVGRQFLSYPEETQTKIKVNGILWDFFHL